MQKVVLGNTGLSVSRLCIGAWQLGGPLFFDGQPDGHPDPGEENVLRMIRSLHDRGINFIDTAEQYSAGESERRVGEALRGQRDEWVISTKFGYRVGPNSTRIDDSSPGTILDSLHGSLKRLGTDYIDVYLYHCAPDPAELEEAAKVLGQAKRDGKIRFVGISGNNLELCQALHEHGLLDVLQFHANLLSPADELRSFCVENNIGSQVRGVMAGGRLSGKYFSGATNFSADDNRIKWPEDYSKYAGLQDAVPEGWTMAQVATRWILDQPGNHSICVGAKSLEDYEGAIKAACAPALDQETLTRLDACIKAL